MAKKFDLEDYKIIENDFIEAKKYISFERTANLEVDSPFLHNEIVLLGSKVELAMKKLIGEIIEKEIFSPGNISEYRQLLLVLFPDIESYESVLINSELVFTPFKGWSQKKLSWWDAYNSIKHGSSRLPKLEHALNLLSAYQILLFLIYFKEQQESEYVFYSLGEMPQLLELNFQKELHPFGAFGFGFPKEQIKECVDSNIIEQEILRIKREKNNKKM